MFNQRKNRVCKGLMLFVTLYALAAVVTARQGDRTLYPARADGVTIYVVNTGFHTDIALPAEQVRLRGGVLAEASRAAGDKHWLYYGWGDAGFFSGKGVSLARIGDGLCALFMPGNPSVMRIFGLDPDPEQAFADPVAAPVVLSPAGFDALARHIEASFVTRNGAPLVAPVSDKGMSFFVSREHFSVFRVCNHWTADQLSAAGLPTTPLIDGAAPLFALDLRLRAHVKRD